MKDQSREEPKIVAAAEKQMRSWSFAQELTDRTMRLDQGQRPGAKLGQYITISREAGVGGEEIAQLVGQKVGWQVLDRELLDLVAERYRLNRSMLELVDETQSNWVYDLLGSWMDASIISHDKYVTHLTRIILAAAKHGDVVFVGRGAAFLLPPNQGLSVRIIASEPYRIRGIMAREQLSESKARQTMNRWDRERQQFVREFFSKDVADPHLYDVVLNVERLGPEIAADMIIAAHHRRTAAG